MYSWKEFDRRFYIYYAVGGFAAAASPEVRVGVSLQSHLTSSKDWEFLWNKTNIFYKVYYIYIYIYNNVLARV